jgi:hypothetical protein
MLTFMGQPLVPLLGFRQRQAKLFNYLKTQGGIRMHWKWCKVSHPTVCSTIVEDPLQIGQNMQNKANFQKSQMDVRLNISRIYEKKSDWTFGENKPKQSQS